MPIDIASGIVELQFDDIAIPGKVDLVWDRYYSTAFLDRPSTPLGRGWTNRYFSTLTQQEDGYEFVTPDGVAEFVSDPESIVEQGGRAINYGAFLEVFKQSQRYIVQHWDVETGEIERYCFKPGPVGEPWRLSSIDDVTGQKLDIAWKEDGKLAGIRQHLEKRTLILSYTPAGYIDAIVFQAATGEQQILARYEYNAIGQLTAAYDAANNADRYEYGQQGRLTREVVKDGGVFTYKYDEKGRCIKSSGLDRYDEKRLRFLEATGITELTDSHDRTYYYHYLQTGQIVREVDPLGNEKTTDYDEHGRIASKIDATGAVTKYTYDDTGNRASVTDGLGNTTQFTHNEHHLPLSITDPQGQLWRRDYDSANRMVGTLDPLDNRWLINYDSDGNAAEIVNPLGASKHQQYTQGVLTAVTDWMGNIVRFKLDMLGRVVERQGALGEITRFHYDAIGNPVEVILPDGAMLHARYDDVGNLTRYIDASGNTTQFRYGPCQRLLEQIDPVGGIVRYIWGSEPDELEQIINEKGDTYIFFRDEAGRITREKSFDGAERHFQYDADGHAIAYTNANGETISIQRDALHRVIGQTLPDGEQVSYSYDPIGNLLSAVNADIAVKFERDPLGRIVKEMQGEKWVTSRYDAIGNLIHTSTSLGHSVDYDVDANGFVSKLTTLDNQTLEFKRNVYGEESGRQMPGDIAMEQRYDDLGRLIEQRVGPGRLGNGDVSVIPQQHEIIHRKYRYDRNGSLASIVDGRWGRVDYVYDPAERLLQTIRTQGLSEAFTYDATNNITRMQSQDKNLSTDEVLVYGAGNRLLQKGNTRYEYDAEGRRIKKITEADSNSPKVWLYEWNAQDRLKSLTRPDGEVWSYKYDAFTRRIEKLGPNKKQHFLWDKDVIICESHEDKLFSSWIFEPYSFSLLASVQNFQVYSVINDHLGTPNVLIDNKGKIVWSSVKKSWGETFKEYKNKTVDSVDCQFGFQGQYFDIESNLYYNRFRYYDPNSAQFILQDPIGLSGGLNFYFYVKNPIGWIDSLGLASDPWLPHGAAQNDVISKGLHFNAGDPNKTELKVVVGSDGKPQFERVFSKDSDAQVKRAVDMANEKFNSDPAWRQRLLQSAKDVKMSLFENFGRHDKAKEAKKVEKAIKKAIKDKEKSGCAK